MINKRRCVFVQNNKRCLSLNQLHFTHLFIHRVSLRLFHSPHLRVTWNNKFYANSMLTKHMSSTIMPYRNRHKNRFYRSCSYRANLILRRITRLSLKNRCYLYSLPGRPSRSTAIPAFIRHRYVRVTVT